MTLRKPFIAILFTGLLVFAGCTLPKYSFTGAAVPENVKTISIATFPNYASLAPPALSQTFTETLKDIFIRQTSLTMVGKNGDLQMDGQITDYRIAQEAISGQEQATLNRLTITVKVNYVDTKNPDNSYEQSFSNFAQFDSDANPSDVQDQLIDEINEKMVQDIFNRTLGNW